MTMKFWFGKREAEQSGQRNGSCDVLTIPDHANVCRAAVSSVLVAPQRGGASAEPRERMAPPFSAGAASAKVREPAAAPGETGVTEVKAQAAPAPVKGPAEAPKGAVPAQLEKGSEENKQALAGRLPPEVPVRGVAPSPEAAKTLLRPLGSPVRLAAAPAAPAVPAAPVSQGLSAEAAGNAPRPTFGLRPKGNVPVAVPAPAAAQPAAKEAAERREESEAVIRPKTDQRALYYELMNGLYDAVLILDDQGHIVDSNARVATVLGYTREETWDLPIDKVITGMTSQMFEHLRRNLAENHHILMDARCFRQDGTSFAGEVGVSTLTLTRGSNMVLVIRNVDRRKNAMEELRKGQAALQIALAPSFVCDTDGFFLITNQALLESFGIPDETQAKSVRFVDLLPDAARFFLRASCGEKVRESLRVPTPDGEPVKIELSLSPIQSGQTITAVAGSILQV